MKIYLIIFTLLSTSTLKLANADSSDFTLEQLPSSPSFYKIKKTANTNIRSCQSEIYSYDAAIAEANLSKSHNKVSLKFLNSLVKSDLKKMSSGVFQHVTMSVASSLLSFNSDSLSPESIAHYIADGTQPFLPFIYANGVMITEVNSKGRTIIYRTEMPVTKNNAQAAALAAAGRETAITSICDDMDKINDLLEQEIIIQYDYYDSTGAFYSSFTINGATKKI